MAGVVTFVAVFQGWRPAETAGRPRVAAAPIIPISFAYQSQYGNGVLNAPQGISVDSSGNRYVVDQAIPGVVKFDPAGNKVQQWGSFGGANGEFDNPSDISVDPNGNLYVADSGNNRIQEFDTSGNFVRAWNSFDDGSPQSLSNPTSLVANGAAVLVADFNNNRIVEFGPSGEFFTEWTTPGNPYGVGVDSVPDVYVADNSNNRIEKYDAGGTLITQWGAAGTGSGQFEGIGRLTVDSSDRVYVVDGSNSRVEVFDSSGDYLGQFGTSGSGNGQFSFPRGVAIDQAGNADVTDDSGRVQVFHPLHVYIPLIEVPAPTPTPLPDQIQNGNFDSGLNGWQTGSSGGFPPPSASNVGPLGDTSSALLGNPAYPCGGSSVPIGSTWISQVVTVPPTGHPTLTFQYDLWTENNVNGTFASFDVFVGPSDDDAHRIFRNPSTDQGFGCSKPIVNFGWQTPSGPIDLSHYAGQTITLTFQLSNGVNGLFNTYVYLDTVAISP
jgi:DNA-binding beta-propeller fold protein YncE